MTSVPGALPNDLQLDWINGAFIDTYGESRGWFNFLKDLLEPSAGNQRIYYVCGRAGSGKTVLVHFVEKLLGRDSVVSLSPRDLADKYVLNSIFEKKLLVLPDVVPGILKMPIVQEVLKKLSGGDLLTSNQKYGSYVTGAFKGIILITSNYQLSYINDDGLSRRIVQLFSRPPKEHIKDFADVLMESPSGLINQIMNMEVEQLSIREIQMQTEKLDPLSDFCEAWIESADGVFTSTRVLFDKYEVFLDSYGLDPSKDGLQINTFAFRLKDILAERWPFSEYSRYKAARGFRNVRLRLEPRIQEATFPGDSRDSGTSEVKRKKSAAKAKIKEISLLEGSGTSGKIVSDDDKNLAQPLFSQAGLAASSKPDLRSGKESGSYKNEILFKEGDSLEDFNHRNTKGEKTFETQKEIPGKDSDFTKELDQDREQLLQSGGATGDSSPVDSGGGRPDISVVVVGGSGNTLADNEVLADMVEDRVGDFEDSDVNLDSANSPKPVSSVPIVRRVRSLPEKVVNSLNKGVLNPLSSASSEL